MKRLDTLNYYEILEISPAASQGEIRTAYERAKRTYNRDSIGIYSLLKENEIEELSRLIEEAYQTIGNETTRREYDRTLGCDELEETKARSSSFYQHVPESSVPLYPDETSPVGSDQHQRVKEMISESGFEYSGPALRKIREALGLDLGEISTRTKVSRTNLDFIESEKYDRLPALVYLKGFLSEYAKRLSLDPPKVLDDYVSRYRKWEKEKEM
ncbi:MAG: DnaJ domain-containing protein [Proteobacteria bacterium]|nr:DnaJ domain-containing protein [Pseudomonadota bacterium]NIS68804.1 DnaJ domain-containing protein [Pseudomonadota bacterium]